ncbi:unnamed protein product [Prunus armeniaca]|uniref:Uncharacterized protein n=1 Tax=Prunus armeniaca TaxID=36596 RepID=A0A6J5U0K0_PRUAR|nr:unnamed protein product [Prunus armeniaca]
MVDWVPELSPRARPCSRAFDCGKCWSWAKRCRPVGLGKFIPSLELIPFVIVGRYIVRVLQRVFHGACRSASREARPLKLHHYEVSWSQAIVRLGHSASGYLGLGGQLEVVELIVSCCWGRVGKSCAVVAGPLELGLRQALNFGKAGSWCWDRDCHQGISKSGAILVAQLRVRTVSAGILLILELETELNTLGFVSGAGSLGGNSS